MDVFIIVFFLLLFIYLIGMITGIELVISSYEKRKEEKREGCCNNHVEEKDLRGN